jgi:hypothetical protein
MFFVSKSPDYLDSVMVSMITSGGVMFCVLTLVRQVMGSILIKVKLNTIKLFFYASLFRQDHLGVRAKTSWVGSG